MFSTLYSRLAATLVILLLFVGLSYVLISTSAAHHYSQRANQSFNRQLAENLVADRNLIAQGRLNMDALKETFRQYMVINPSIEIYLLDQSGRILSYSAEPGKVKRQSVSLAAIQSFLNGVEDFPLLGDDPRSHNRHKAFSVTPIPSADNVEGYLYVVLNGEQFDSVNDLIQESYFLRLSSWTVTTSLIIGLLAGLVIFYRLTRRLRILSARMDDFDHNDFNDFTPYPASRHKATDEIELLGQRFNHVAARVKQQLGELEKNDHLRRELVAHVSHDLRTPIALLRGYLESLNLKRDTLSEKECQEYIDISLRQSEYLSNLVSELFELATLEAKDSAPNFEFFSLAELIQDVLQKFHLQASEQSIHLTMPPPNEASIVYGDIALTERVLENLIKNSMRYTPPGGYVTVSLECKETSVFIHVSDSGSGLIDTELPKVFEPFYRAEMCANDKEHVGLGLAIAKRIVELMNGKISVNSRINEGATFTFSLPTLKKP